MKPTAKRTVRLLAEEIERLRCAMGISLDSLAAKAHIDIKTLNRKMEGEPAYHRTARKIANVLGVPCEQIQEGSQLRPPQPAEFKLGLRVHGTINSKEQVGSLLAVVQDTIERLSKIGITVEAHESSLAVTQDNRIIVFIFGKAAGDEDFYIFAAVRLDRYEAFLVAQKRNELDMHDFSTYGEVITTGWGKVPTNEVVEEIAKEYKVNEQQIKTKLGLIK
jgi:transcriptional regulator with XRE-family HTH domain